VVPRKEAMAIDLRMLAILVEMDIGVFLLLK
jgi:hypothetical protein